LLGVVVMALSAMIPIYRRESNGTLCRLTDEELAADCFVRGVEQFAPAETAASNDLLVFCLRELEAALPKLHVANLDAARVQLILRQSPRR
jgi:hypothetical protein